VIVEPLCGLGDTFARRVFDAARRFLQSCAGVLAAFACGVEYE